MINQIPLLPISFFVHMVNILRYSLRKLYAVNAHSLYLNYKKYAILFFHFHFEVQNQAYLKNKPQFLKSLPDLLNKLKNVTNNNRTFFRFYLAVFILCNTTQNNTLKPKSIVQKLHLDN